MFTESVTVVTDSQFDSPLVLMSSPHHRVKRTQSFHLTHFLEFPSGNTLLSWATVHLFPLFFSPVQEALKTLAVSLSPHNTTAAPPPLSKPHVPLTPIPGTPDTMASIHLLPARYRRRPLTVDEMEFIQVRAPYSASGRMKLQTPSINICLTKFVLCVFATAWWTGVTRRDPITATKALIRWTSICVFCSSAQDNLTPHNTRHRINYYISWNVHTFYYYCGCTGPIK